MAESRNRLKTEQWKINVDFCAELTDFTLGVVLQDGVIMDMCF